MDEIRIENLEVYGAHGVLAGETRNGQMFMINAVLKTKLRPAGLADDLSLSTHYGHVCQFMNRYLREHTFLLIEAAAEHLAGEVLLRFPLVHSIVLELKKPHAPIGLPFSSVSVKIERGWEKAYLGIGSNMGDKQNFLDTAVRKLKKNPRIKDVRCSGFISTAPYGGVEQDDFLNGAIELQTLLPPYELLEFLHQLEGEAGRERNVRWGPRTLDLDILFYGDLVSGDSVLTLPHPDMANREFVLKPLDELCPWQYNPVNGKTVRQMLRELEEKPYIDTPVKSSY
ncbi:2-amino-4-hydroxy-6-hydroxymethyldihydropteridine diphosphokinase [Lachnospiraceae bacterium]|nr:2-amino-4-hydroxy-6-hydroxymethyldihydropteridine diphosphokinase [Lachnospiraceae bacterium]